MKRRFPAPSGATQKATDETLRAEYQEICDSHRAITDFRGKLLGLLPIASGTGIFLLLDKPIKTPDTTFTTFLVAAGIFGAAVTIGLYFYEYGGIWECHRLRECGKNLERELKIESDYSRFQNTQPGRIGPPVAGVVVYFAVVVAWIFVSVHGLVSPNLKLAGWKVEGWIGLIIILFYLIAVIATMRHYMHVIAIEHVIAQERKDGRRPENVSRKGMPFDISSPPRKIEVKSFRRSARGDVITLKNRQYKAAMADPENFYIYVVDKVSSAAGASIGVRVFHDALLAELLNQPVRTSRIGRRSWFRIMIESAKVSNDPKRAVERVNTSHVSDPAPAHGDPSQLLRHSGSALCQGLTPRSETATWRLSACLRALPGLPMSDESHSHEEGEHPA